MATTNKPTTTAASTESSSTIRRRPPNARMVQNFHLVWLDASIDEVNNDDCHNSISKLRQVVNTVNTFINVDECIDFISGIKDVKTFMISSGAFGQTIVPMVHDKPQVNTIYIFCGNKARHEKWAKDWLKVNGVYTDIRPICEALKQAVQDCDQNSVSISFVKKTDGSSNQNLDQLDQSFMYTQILKEILLTIDFEQKHINEFLTYCREQLAGNSIELKNVDRIKAEYFSHQPIWWYTYDCFLYSMLNRALRLMEVDLIIKMGFFVRDLHQHIITLHTEQYSIHQHKDSFSVYRGQGLSQTDFDQLKTTQGGLLSFNNFLSTSQNRDVSLEFARRTMATSHLVGVLFVIRIHPSVSATPFANTGKVSYYHEEEDEILFSMHSVFRIGEVKQFEKDNGLWQVNLTLTGDNDSQLQALTTSMQEETEGSTGWLRLGKLMIKLGHFDKAEALYETLLEQTSSEDEQAHLYHMLGYIKKEQGEYVKAIEFYEKTVEINERILSPPYIGLASTYSNIGSLYATLNQYSEALEYHGKAIEIEQKTVPVNYLGLAHCYNSYSSVYFEMQDYSQALLYSEKALKIRQKNLPLNHPDLATSYNNISLMYDGMDELSKALSFQEKALEIREKILPTNHPDLAVSYGNTGRILAGMKNYEKALLYQEKTLQIFQKIFPATHPHLAVCSYDIGDIYEKLRQYSTALSFYQRALNIWQLSLPPNHPTLQMVQNSIKNVTKKL